MIFWSRNAFSRRHALSSMNSLLYINGQNTTSAFHKVVQQQHYGEVDKTMVIYVTFLRDVACQKLLKLANV